MTGRLIGKRGWVDQGQEGLALLLDRAVSGGVPLGGRGAAMGGIEARHRPLALHGCAGTEDNPRLAQACCRCAPGHAGGDSWLT